MRCGIVVIGRNEGERLKRCLHSLPPALTRVYVDSGSDDGSQDFARSLGLAVVELNTAKGFTAARARNAGLEFLRQDSVEIEFVLVIDGDCELDREWIGAAIVALEAEPQLAAVFGRRRERFPDASVYNRQCDDEWNVPVGLVTSCGGDAMFRLAALSEVGDYQPDIIAGEEPDLCLRLAQRNWQIRRIDAEMTLHDANILHFGQWWRRARRSGHAYAEHVWRNGKGSIPSWRRQIWSIMLWAFGLPLAAFLFLVGHLAGYPTLLAALGTVMIYPLQWVRLAMRGGKSSSNAFVSSGLIILGKFAEFGGAMRFFINHLHGYAPKIIEYKGRS